MKILEACACPGQVSWTWSPCREAWLTRRPYYGFGLVATSDLTRAQSREGFKVSLKEKQALSRGSSSQ